MAFDTATRNELQKLVSRARDRLVEEFTSQCQGDYGIQPDGTALDMVALAHRPEEEQTRARLLRDRVEHLAAGLAGPKRRVDAVARLVREQAFTVLNRLCALRMCEERGLVQACVRDGTNSKGFMLFEKTAGALGGDTFSRYRLYLELLFDELAVDLGVLFDRFSPLGLLFPRESALHDLLALINTPVLKHIWPEDEAVGWIYQYFNSQDERQKMRKESSAPRNSRELAVRNQFFSPRYVVEFLIDNTLGTTWYEMQQGETELVQQCRYLVRRPKKTHRRDAGHAEKKIQEIDSASSASLRLNPKKIHRRDAESAEKTIHENPSASSAPLRSNLPERDDFEIPFRQPKDPRDIKLLDPACGSGHFLLYAFDLFEVIYREAWTSAIAGGDSPRSETTGQPLAADYPTEESLARAIPGLILRHNLHGIDIDPRAAQIAALALWLRAQRAWQAQQVKPAARPRITRTNIACAEPMPGEADVLREFAGQLKPPVLGQLIAEIFKQMRLAGEAGSLLRIADEMRSALDAARRQWLDDELNEPTEQMELFPDLAGSKPRQLRFDLSGITQDGFWTQAEGLILAGLRAYTEEAQTSDSMGRRLFVEDAAAGFAFIDLCRRQFDVVVMNPPFGAASAGSKAYIGKVYPRSKNDLLAAFVERGVHWLHPGGLLGAITSRTAFFLTSYQKWREGVVLGEARPTVMADLGYGVMDAAMVEAAAYCLRKH